MCACTEPVRTGIGAVCVEYGRPKWPITTLNHTHTNTHTYLVQKNARFFFWHPILVRPAMKRLFFPWKTEEKMARFARAPHDNFFHDGKRRYVFFSDGTGRHILFSQRDGTLHTHIVSLQHRGAQWLCKNTMLSALRQQCYKLYTV